jgi:hypothetical protein
LRAIWVMILLDDEDLQCQTIFCYLRHLSAWRRMWDVNPFWHRCRAQLMACCAGWIHSVLRSGTAYYWQSRSLQWTSWCVCTIAPNWNFVCYDLFADTLLESFCGNLYVT